MSFSISINTQQWEESNHFFAIFQFIIFPFSLFHNTLSARVCYEKKLKLFHSVSSSKFFSLNPTLYYPNMDQQSNVINIVLHNISVSGVYFLIERNNVSFTTSPTRGTVRQPDPITITTIQILTPEKTRKPSFPTPIITLLYKQLKINPHQVIKEIGMNRK